MADKMTSRERMIAALDHRELDHIPLSFMLFNGLKSISMDYVDFIQRQCDMGLDAFVELPPRPPVVVNDYYNLHGIPVNYHPSVIVKEWIERLPDEEEPLMIKEYNTPAGTLRTEVRQTDDWRWGDHVPFLDDYLVPRSRKFLIDGEEDLDALSYLLVDPTPIEVSQFHRESKPAISLAKHRDVLLAGGWGVGADLIGWVYGLQRMLFAVYDQPEFIKRLLGMIADWNRKRMEVVLEAGIDLYIKRAWYENCDFWTPSAYREFLSPILKADIELAHENGARFGYLISSNAMPLLEEFVELGIDVIIGVDPAAWDLEITKQVLGGKVCIWGGVNGHLTVEQGSEGQIRAEVQRAIQQLSPAGGFVLSPVDNVREYSTSIQKNVEIMIDEWQRITNPTV
jgi:hypothetical protein